MRQTPEDFAAAMRRFGVSDDTKVVLYSDHQSAMGVSRLVAAAGVRPRQRRGAERRLAEMVARKAVPSRPAPARRARPATSPPKQPRDLMADKDEVKAAIGDGAICTLNALGRGAAYRHRRQHLWPAGPHRRQRERSGGASARSRRPTRSCRPTNCAGSSTRSARWTVPVIVYCGGGIAATADALALIMLGHANVKLYDASMSEWAKDAGAADGNRLNRRNTPCCCRSTDVSSPMT